MLNVTKEHKGTTLCVRLSGSIEETVNFETLIGETVADMEINCKEVPRINSVGVKSWIKYFQGLTNGGSKLRFTECSTAIVEQFNLIMNFNCGGIVESIFVPFSCVSCKSELVGLYKTEELKKIQLQIPELKCTKCGKNAVFDDIPEEFFGFIMR